MTNSNHTLRSHVEAAAHAGNLADAMPRLDAAVAATPQDPGTRTLRASVLMSLGRHDAALEDLGHLLELDPSADAMRFQRALTLYGLERLGEALEDFQELCRRRPKTVEPWANAGVILLRMERFGEAVTLLREAVRLSPGHAPLQRSLANALAGAGALGEAMPLYESAIKATPRDPAALTDHAMALMGVGQPHAAHERLLAALAIDPADQTALAGLYLSANELGLHDIVDLLIDYPTLLSVTMRPDTMPLDRDALRAAVLAHPGLVWQPAGRSTYQGRQSPMLDLSPGSAFEAFGRVIHQVVLMRLAALRNDPALRAHPWVRTLPTHWRLQAWCTVLDSGGRQTPHIHPAGRLSGVYYLDVGGTPKAGNGTLTFGHPPREVTTTAPPKLHTVPPHEDGICCFPSYFFHHTEPFQGTSGPRISLAFDVMPA